LKRQDTGFAVTVLSGSGIDTQILQNPKFLFYFREYNQAQTCLFRNLITHCSFSNRPLRQMMALLIEVEYDYQPYCFQPQMNARTFDELSSKSKIRVLCAL